MNVSRSILKLDLDLHLYDFRIKKFVLSVLIWQSKYPLFTIH